MPFCPQCGSNNPASASFCDQCGAELIPVPGAGPTPAPSTMPVPQQPLAAGPSTCPQCGNAVIPGEAFCDNCGAALLGSGRAPQPAQGAPAPPYGGAPPQPSYPPPQPAQPIPTPAQPAPQPVPAPVTPARTTLAPARLIVVGSGATLPLPAAAEAIVGRADPVSNFFPDIDLTDYGALEYGVGRRHMRLFVHSGQVYLEDLDSTNGTFLRNQRLAARSPQALHSSEDVLLGKLALRIEL